MAAQKFTGIDPREFVMKAQRGTSPIDIKTAHKAKMADKRARLPADGEREPVATANLSKNHPDYGMTPAAHAAAKARRKAK